MKPSSLPVSHPVEKVVVALDDALDLLKEYAYANEPTRAEYQNPASLLAQCLALCAQKQAVKPEPIRIVHHLACTGGTLISKCIAAMPNTQVLSEVDPLSPLPLKSDKPRFAPTDMVALMRQSSRGTNPELIIELFLNNLGIIHSEATRLGQRLIIRDHSHSHFCTGAEILKRLSLREIITSRFPALSVVTVRHPVDSFLSLKANEWIHFSPTTFDEYCKRYIAFLRAYEGTPVVRYEDFVSNPHEVMSKICALLEINFSDQFVDLFNVFSLTGDSGRDGNVIEPRPRRTIDKSLADALESSPNYHLLRKILRYDE